MRIYNSIEELVGKTPLVRLTNFEKQYEIKAIILAKLEYLNPAGSVKDRVAKQMIFDAEQSGKLKKGGTIIEPTSGNTGIGICAISAIKGYKAVIVMPDSMSKERIALMKAYGAEVVLTPGKEGMTGAIKKAEELNKEIDGSIIAGQFSNPSNPKAHTLSTGPEIYEDTDGQVDIFVAGIGTGGTVSGTGKYLKSKNDKIKVVGVEPLSSPLLTKGEAGPHKIQGIGANFIPENLNRNILDEVIDVSNADAYEMSRNVAKSDAILVGISSGAALFAAKELAKRPENEGKTIVVLLPDTGDRYLSTDLFE